VDALAVFNSLEAVFWTTIGLVVFRKSRFPDSRQRLGQIASAWFVLFGISDVIEVFTGAWWRPWPLLVLKASGVIALVTCGLIFRRLTAAAK
jgi:hypothetical protein